MKKDFPSIKISGVTKKVYSLDLSGGGSEPSTLRLSFVWGKENYDLNTKTEITVTIGSFYTFKGHIISFSTKESVSSGRTCELTLVDTSIILDKIYVGLKGKDGGSMPSILRKDTTTEQLPGNINLSNYRNTTATNSTVNSNKVSNLSLYSTHGNFDNMIFVGDYIDPCSNLSNDSEKDLCDPCTPNANPNLYLDCQKSRGFSKLDVDYKFNDLIEEAERNGVNFNNTFSSPINYRAKYTGTLREVLGNWCQDFGFSFYWKDDKVFFFDLKNGIRIKDSTIKNSNSCKIEEFSTSRSIEGISKDINVAYFGRDGEMKEYDCSQDQGSGSSSGITNQLLLYPLSISSLSQGNTPLLNRYKNSSLFRALCVASYYSKELRDLICFSKLLEFESPQKVKVGPQTILGWDIKGVCHAGTTKEQGGKYGADFCKQIYSKLMVSNKSQGSFFTEAKIKELKEGGAYFLIVEDIGSKAYDFELGVAKAFCGKYWARSTNNIEDKTFESPDGSAKGFSNVTRNNNFVYPDINISHPYIRDSNIASFDQDNIVVLDRTPIWSPDPNSQNVENFLKGVKSYYFSDRTLEANAVGVTDTNIKLYLVWSFGGTNQPKIEYNISRDLSPEERPTTSDGQGRLGLMNNTVPKIKFSITNNKSKSLDIEIFAPTEENYKIRSKKDANSFKFGKIKAIIPKLEMVFATQGENSDKYVSVKMNNKDITNGDLSTIQRNDNRCYIDEAKIKTYADKILSNLNINLQQEKETRNYSIFGLPNSLLGPEDGLVSFSIRLDQSGTRTSLSFSNSFPINTSDNIKSYQLNNLLRSNPGKSYINII
jgi:hypothetical protein